MSSFERFDNYLRTIQAASEKPPELENQHAQLLCDLFFDDLAELVNGYGAKADAVRRSNGNCV